MSGSSRAPSTSDLFKDAGVRLVKTSLAATEQQFASSTGATAPLQLSAVGLASESTPTEVLYASEPTPIDVLYASEPTPIDVLYASEPAPTLTLGLEGDLKLDVMGIEPSSTLVLSDSLMQFSTVDSVGEAPTSLLASPVIAEDTQFVTFTQLTDPTIGLPVDTSTTGIYDWRAQQTAGDLSKQLAAESLAAFTWLSRVGLPTDTSTSDIDGPPSRLLGTGPEGTGTEGTGIIQEFNFVDLVNRTVSPAAFDLGAFDVFGDLAPGQTVYGAPIYNPELSSAAVPPPWSQDRCYSSWLNPNGAAQLVIGLAANYVLVRTDRWGSNTFIRDLERGGPLDPYGNLDAVLNEYLTCGNGVKTSQRRYQPKLDHDIARLPDGRLVHVGQYHKYDFALGPLCFGTSVIGGFAEVERALVVRVSTDCGLTWPIEYRTIIDASTIKHPDGKIFRWIDRPSLYVDVRHEMMYLVFRMNESSPPTETSENRTVILAASTSFDTTPSWDTAGHGVTTAQLWNVMPQLSIAPLAAPALPAPEGLRRHAWRLVYPGVMGIVNVRPDPVSYMSFTYTPFQIAWVVDLVVDMLYSRPTVWPRYVHLGNLLSDEPFDLHHGFSVSSNVIMRFLDRSSEARHVLWPDLLWPRGAETNLAHRYQHVLSWVEVSQNSELTPTRLLEHNPYAVFALVDLYGQRTRSLAWDPDRNVWENRGVLGDSYIRRSYLKPPYDFAPTWFFGDYRTGTFIGDHDGGARYLVPWAETDDSYPAPNAQPFGAIVVQP